MNRNTANYYAELNLICAWFSLTILIDSVQVSILFNKLSASYSLTHQNRGTCRFTSERKHRVAAQQKPSEPICISYPCIYVTGSVAPLILYNIVLPISSLQ